MLRKLPDDDVRRVILGDPEEQQKLEDIERVAKDQIESLQTFYDEKVGRLRRGDELPPGVIKLVKVYLAIKRKIPLAIRWPDVMETKAGLPDSPRRGYAVFA